MSIATTDSPSQPNTPSPELRRANESAEHMLSRLLVLKELGPGTFEVVADDEGQDNVPGAC